MVYKQNGWIQIIHSPNPPSVFTFLLQELIQNRIQTNCYNLECYINQASPSSTERNLCKVAVLCSVRTMCNELRIVELIYPFALVL